MPKAYWIAHVDIEDPVAYRRYQEANAEPFRRYGARFLTRGGGAEVMEGQTRARHVVIEFPSLEAARACYHSEAYQAAKALRTGASQADLVIQEGYEGAQPGDR